MEILAEVEARTRRMEKTEWLKKAWNDQGDGDVQVGKEDRYCDQFMPQEEFLTSMEEEYSQTEMDITVCVAEVAQYC